VVAYFLDSCNLGTRIVDFDDTPIVIDKHVRAVTFAFHKGEPVATSLSVGNLGSLEKMSNKKKFVVEKCMANPIDFCKWRAKVVWWRAKWRGHLVTTPRPLNVYAALYTRYMPRGGNLRE
ncbi:hypothetical protein Tco_0763812, partial [Tanacetum coccineum]